MTLLHLLLWSPAFAVEPAEAAAESSARPSAVPSECPSTWDAVVTLDSPTESAWSWSLLPEPDADTSWPTRSGGSSSSGSSSGSSKNNSNSKSNSSDGIFAKGKIGKWNYQPYVTPGGGVQINTSNSGDTATSIVAGVDVGVKYWRKDWAGDLYAGGSYTTGDGLNGYDLHLGDATGIRDKYWGATLGLEGFYNGYLYSNGSSAMKPSAGVAIPVELTAGPKEYYAFGGVTPSFLADASRRVDWSDPAYDGAFGFGNEFEWHAGVGIKLKGVSGELGFAQSVTVAGVQNTPTVALSVTGS